jgi:hypothetical protein
LNVETSAAPAAAADEPVSEHTPRERRRTGSLTRRMIVVAAGWIAALLLIGGFALDRVLTRSIVDNFDQQLVLLLNKSLIAASEIGPDGGIRLIRAPADQRFIEAYSGLYFQVTDVPGNACRLGAESPFCLPSRSLWDRRLHVSKSHEDVKPHLYDSAEFSQPGHTEPLRIAERDVVLPGSNVHWRFQLAQSRETIDEQIHRLRSTLIWSFTALGAGLLVLAALQTFYGLWPLRRVRQEVAAIRSGKKMRISQDFPSEVRPLAEEINELWRITKRARRRRGGTRAISPTRSRPPSPSSPMQRQPTLPTWSARFAGKRRSCAARSTTTSPGRVPSAGERRPMRARRSGKASRQCSEPSIASTNPLRWISPATIARRCESNGKISMK